MNILVFQDCEVNIAQCAVMKAGIQGNKMREEKKNEQIKVNHDLRQQSSYISFIFQQTDSLLCQQFACSCWLNIHVTSTGWSVSVSYPIVNWDWLRNVIGSSFQPNASMCLCQNPSCGYGQDLCGMWASWIFVKALLMWSYTAIKEKEKRFDSTSWTQMCKSLLEFCQRHLESRSADP